MNRMRHSLCRAAVLLVLWALPAAALSPQLQSSLRRVAGVDAVVHAVDPAGRVLVDLNGGRGFVPASTIKVFTALLALEHLGPDHRFVTAFGLDDDVLVIRGGGDPYLVSEEIDAIARQLAPRLQGRVLAGVAIDDSYFGAPLRVPGVGRSTNPYDAPSSATAVNFNTIGVVKRGGRIESAEPQTPLTPHALALARGLRFERSLRFQIGEDPADVRRYVGELFAAKLRQAGVRVGTLVRAGRLDAAAPLYVHQSSRPLYEVLRAMLAVSNNFIANQVFLSLGAEVEGAPATLAKSVRVARRFLQQHPDLDGLHVVEGSGLAYENRATAPAMAALLAHFAPHRGLLKLEHHTRHKTGTLKSVASLVGYLESARHGIVRYTIALPGGMQARRWQVVEALRRGL